jgi:glycosyltransferase involved in cell wall biosynthesis
LFQTMTGSAIEVSVVMPAYNEESTIGAAIDEVVAQVLALVPAGEIIIVDDGSRDLTGTIVSQRAANDRRIRYIRQPNGGHGPAVISGLSAARGNSILLLDSDCQVNLSDFSDHWHAFQRHQAVLGIRRPRFDGLHRVLISAGMTWLIRLLFGTAPVDAGTPFKLFRMEHWGAIKQLVGPANPIPAVLLAAYLVSDVQGVAQRRVIHRARAGSPSSLRPLRLAQVCLKAISALVRFRLNYSNRADVELSSHQ